MTKPIVLVIAPTPYFSDRGCHIRIYEELKLIDQLGYHAEVVTYPLGRSLGTTPIHRTHRLPWYHKTTAGPAFGKVWLDVLMIPLAYRLAKQLRPKIIHAHLAESMLIAFWLKLFLRIPIVLDLQSVLSEELKSYGGLWKWFVPLARVYERWAIRQATQVIVSNTKAAQTTKMTVVADGAPQVYQGDTEKKYDIVYSGGLGLHKGTPQLINLLQRFNDKKILIIAADPTNHWKKIIPHTTWLERVPYEELLPMLAQAKIGIEPKPSTSTEGSAKELNYMAAGVLPARTAAEVERLLTTQATVDRSRVPLWSNQLPVLKHVYESCTA